MYSQNVFLEKDRIPVFIGSEGKTKEEFEKHFDVTITVNSETGEVQMESSDSVNLFIMGNVVLAINLGHSPENAMKLEHEHMVLDTIDIKTLIRNQDRLRVVLGRIIGKDGSTRRVIEEVTNCSVSVYDHFVSVIGPYENTLLVHEALQMLIKGSSHKSFYGFLERNREKMDTGLL